MSSRTIGRGLVAGRGGPGGPDPGRQGGGITAPRSSGPSGAVECAPDVLAPAGEAPAAWRARPLPPVASAAWRARPPPPAGGGVGGAGRGGARQNGARPDPSMRYWGSARSLVVASRPCWRQSMWLVVYCTRFMAHEKQAPHAWRLSNSALFLASCCALGPK